MSRLGTLSAVLALALAACAAPSRDPAKVDLFGAIINEVTGVYEEDDAAIRREIESLEARRAILKDEADRLAGEARRLSGQRRAAAERLSRLNADTAAMNARLAELSRREGQDQARVAALRDRERALSDRVIAAGGDGGTTAAEIARLEAERMRLLSDIEALIATG